MTYPSGRRHFALLASAVLAGGVRAAGALTAGTACLPVDDDAGEGDGTSSSGGGDGGGRQAIDSEKLCTRLVNDCKQPTTPSDCQKQYAAVLVTPACADALANGTCDDLTSSTSSVVATCFPPCSGALAECNGDGTINVCTADGTTTVLDCQGYCKAQGGTYSGTCGQSFDAQVSESPQCWCQ